MTRLVTLLLLLALPPWRGPANAPRVAAVGDSVLGQLESEGPTHPHARDAFTRSLIDEGWQAAVRTRNAWRTHRVRTLVDQAVARHADVIVVSAGAGDVRWVREQAHPQAARSTIPGEVDGLLAHATGRCVVWPTIPLEGSAGDRHTAAVLNAALRAAAREDDAVRVPDWSRLAADHPGWFIGDHVHLSRPGEAAFQSTLLHAVHRCPT